MAEAVAGMVAGFADVSGAEPTDTADVHVDRVAKTALVGPTGPSRWGHGQPSEPTG